MAVLGLLKLILANTALALAISSYAIEAGIDKSLQIVIWVGTYGVFTVLDCVGVQQSATAQVAATILCVIILIVYSGSTLSIFDANKIRKGGIFHSGMLGFLQGLPFALQFFDGFEEIPLLMGYSINPDVTIPRAILISYITVFLLAFAVMIGGAGTEPAAELLKSEAPLMDGIDVVYGIGNPISEALDYLIIIGLLVNFFAFVIFASKQVQAIAEGGQLPSFLAYKHPTTGAPILASITASILGVLLCSGFVIVFGEDAAQNTLVTAALMPAVLGYIVLLECIPAIRKIESNKQKFGTEELVKIGFDPGSLRWQYGTFGARLAQILCLIITFALFVLATVDIDFAYGLIVVFLLALFLYGIMFYFIRRQELNPALYPMGGQSHQLLSTKGDDEIDDEDVSDNPFNFQNQHEMTSKFVHRQSTSPRSPRSYEVMEDDIEDDNDEDFDNAGEREMRTQIMGAIEMTPFSRKFNKE
jgi:amino acid transporter